MKNIVFKVFVCVCVIVCGTYLYPNFSNVGSAQHAGSVRIAHSAKEIDDFVVTNSFTANKTPNIYVVFFDTLRPDYALAQHGVMDSFFNNNFSPKYSHASGTSTIYSMFSFFHGMPGFLTYDFISKQVDNNSEYGSIFLKIIKKLGYKIYTYGEVWDLDAPHIDPNTSQPDTDWIKFLTTVFGLNNLLTSASSGIQIGVSNVSALAENQDLYTLNMLKRALPTIVDSAEKHFTFLTFYNNHDNYQWLPWLSGISREQDVISRYKNSVITSDVIFAEVLELLKTLPGYDDAVIILMSDHGERFLPLQPGSRGRSPGHGGFPDHEVTPNLLSIQFTSRSLYNERSNDAFANIGDIFPTVLDYIGVMPSLPKQLSFGQSLLSYARASTLVNASNHRQFPNKIVLINKKYKVWLTLTSRDTPNIADGSLSVDKFTDLNDIPIENLCAHKDAHACNEILNSEFSDALAELYSNY